MSRKTEIKREKDVVRRNHLQRQLDGPDAIAHMTNKIDEKRETRLRMIDEVAKLGRKNRVKAEKVSKRNRLKANTEASSEVKLTKAED
ncbi:MAG: hypothetical protein GY742_11265 [Hyphomicrobiales bacterium]|nr:hypothetical protein [Hyphomicrobiales bacterium]